MGGIYTITSKKGADSTKILREILRIKWKFFKVTQGVSEMIPPI